MQYVINTLESAEKVHLTAPEKLEHHVNRVSLSSPNNGKTRWHRRDATTKDCNARIAIFNAQVAKGTKVGRKRANKRKSLLPAGVEVPGNSDDPGDSPFDDDDIPNHPDHRRRESSHHTTNTRRSDEGIPH
ncbi:hypothetical protein LTR47_012012, partial [Exophiala xenobiotica]